MMKRFKNSIAALLIVVIFTPGLYFGMAPTPRAEALLSSLLGAGGTVAACYFGSGLFGLLAGSTVLAVGAGAGVTAGGGGLIIPLAVPVAETNPLLSGIDGAAAAFSMSNAASSGGNLFKECVLDPLAWFLKEFLIAQMTDAIVAWIKGGFEGGPVFVQDPAAFMKGLLDTAVSHFLFEMGLDTLLCSPFQLDVRFNLFLDWKTQQTGGSVSTLSCDLDEIFPGVDIDVGYNTFVREGTFDFTNKTTGS